MKRNAGITLTELMITLGVIALMATVVIVAVNPARHFAKTRNVNRQADLEKILGALNQYAIEMNGAFPSMVSTTLQMIGTAATGCNVSCPTATSTTAAACVNLASILSPTYIEQLPIDPASGTAARTNYAIQLINNGTSGVGLRIKACIPELNQNIQVLQ